MDYKQILNEIKPSKEESREILKTSDKLISYLNEVCKDEGITAHASLVGSVAKKTYLSGKSDIDIFISFPLDALIIFVISVDEVTSSPFTSLISSPTLIPTA